MLSYRLPDQGQAGGKKQKRRVKKMKTNINESINRDAFAGKTYTLICISTPGGKTGRQRNERAATAVVQKDEQIEAVQGDRQELPAAGLPQVPDESKNLSPAVPAGCSAEQAAPNTAGGGAG
jgi:hypothetical protein